GGLLRVGPESAGADPGPACYGKGDEPTVTDAHVVLGRIGADQLVGGQMHLDVERSARAVDRIASRLAVDRIAAAAGIVRVANAGMERAIRVVSVERGHDPRDFALLAFGGCGGLHACEMAEDLGILTVLVPAQAGALSALGMLLADQVRDYAAGVLNRTDIENEFRVLERRAARENRGAELTRSADLRYVGQSYELNVPWRGDQTSTLFHAEHERTYGYADAKRATEAVTIRVRARRWAEPLNLRVPARRGRAATANTRRVFVTGKWRDIAVFERSHLPRRIEGPALVLDYGSTTLIAPRWRAAIDRYGTLVLQRDSAHVAH
ncbi:MAG TPA: hydantoinase/oxoprolinase family protein, partial [Bryobacteraceae bacterium]|nr:hydantoinase/oxoprolinase family protein [Bryobacteraceae bacterium]